MKKDTNMITVYIMTNFRNLPLYKSNNNTQQFFCQINFVIFFNFLEIFFYNLLNIPTFSLESQIWLPKKPSKI